ncbi:molybdopterin-dependent oxidoreductase [Infirmifilum sp.]|uniref:molybdopterin-dependent oxidoreductase n=1 Tax=Infirmifilum sp. TaxID=2856575 RepID=UPI003D09D9E3
MSEKLRLVCPRDCYDTCFIEVEPLSLKSRGSTLNPVTGGFLCPRGNEDRKRVFSKDRVLYPYARLNGKTSDFIRIDWETALNLVAEKLSDTLRAHGPGRILHIEYAGNMGLLTMYYPLRLWNRLGAARTDWSICSKSGHDALSLHYGLSYGRLPTDIPSSKLLIFWGFNAAVSAPHIWRLALDARENGSFIVSVDPRRSETAKRSDFWISPRPGSDVALAYGVAYHLITGELLDYDFIERYGEGFEAYREEVLKWTPDRVESITGVDVYSVKRLAELYASLKPSITLIGFGVQKRVAGADIVRAVALLPALVGVHRGFYYSNSKGFFVNTAKISLEDRFQPSRTVSQVALADLIEKGEFNFIFIYNSNPLLTLPRPDKLLRGFMREDVFVVVHETHWTETARAADVVLPAPTFYEKTDVVIPYAHNYIMLSRSVLEPLGESRDEVWLTCRLSEKLGVDRDVCVDRNEALRLALEEAIEGSIDELFKGAVLTLKYRPLSEYQTPSGRIEFYSKTAEEKGFDPLPRVIEKQEGFVLLNSAHPLYTHTQFRDVYGAIPGIVHMNEHDALELGISEGETIEVYNNHGVVELRVHITQDVPRGVLWSPRELIGLNGVAQNVLVGTEVQRLGGGPTFNSTKVMVRKKEG